MCPVEHRLLGGFIQYHFNCCKIVVILLIFSDLKQIGKQTKETRGILQCKNEPEKFKRRKGTPEDGALKCRNTSSSGLEVTVRNKSVAKKLVL
jgi:hypothetical protein